ncbi:MAG TPA: family 43 glycosylhydrolase [Phycisphaerae bacterium]|nr:family 43 glycosylhydrolase [Phycisphaerae bacterium]
MTPRITFLLAAPLLLTAISVARAQTAPAIPPPFTSPAAVYSGISGPGNPVVGNGAGGWRSNQEVLRYDGPDPKPGWQPLGQFACTGSIVKDGLLPPIKPIWDLHLRDTVICVGPDKLYYMTGSSGDNIWDRNDGIGLWRSKDLQHWDYLGLVWSFEKDGTWQKKWGISHEHQVRAIWAPELHYLPQHKKWVLMYSLAGGGGCGIAVSTSGKPEGPYKNPLKSDTRLLGGIDPTIFEDDDGKMYVTAGRGGSIGQLNDDLSDWAVPMKTVKIDKSDARAADGSANIPPDLLARAETGMEGASLFKRNGKYYLGAAAFWKTQRSQRYDSVVCIADNIWGPYTHWHEAVPCGGGTDYFQDNDGRWFCCFFGNDEQAPFREKPGIVQIDFDDVGRIHVADDQPAFILTDGTPTHWRRTDHP